MTIGTIIGTFIYSQGIFAAKIDSIESDSENNVKKVMSNSNKIQNLEISVAKIESKLDTRFDILEELLMDLE